MNKSYNVTYRNLWRNVQSSKRPFLVSHWRLKNNLIWKVVLVSNISRTESDLYNIFAFLSFCFSAIWWTDQPMSKKQWFPWFFQILAKIQWKWSSVLWKYQESWLSSSKCFSATTNLIKCLYVRYYRESQLLKFQFGWHFFAMAEIC